MTDATLIPADASLNSMVHNDPQRVQQEAEAQQDRGMMDSRPKRKLSNETHRSRTDPDATLAQKKGSPRQLKYKVHQSIDAESRVILDTHVTTGARHDNQPYLGQLQRIRDRYRLTIREATADRGYGSADIIRTLQQQGVETFIPLWSGRVGNSKYLKSGLLYEREYDRFRCPQGKYLNANAAVCNNYKRYATSAADCRECPALSTCPTEARKQLPFQRYIRRSMDQDLFEEVQARMRDPTFRHQMSERMWKCEGLFAEAKQNHGLARARYRGRGKVQIQAYLSATVQNLKRLVFLFYHWFAVWWASLVFNRQPARHLDEVEQLDARADPSPARLFQQARPFSATAATDKVFPPDLGRAGGRCRASLTVVLLSDSIERSARGLAPAHGQIRAS